MFHLAYNYVTMCNSILQKIHSFSNVLISMEHFTKTINQSVYRSVCQGANSVILEVSRVLQQEVQFILCGQGKRKKVVSHITGVF